MAGQGGALQFLSSPKCLIVLPICLFAIGCRSRPAELGNIPAPTTAPVEILQKPAIDLARGGAGFPLDIDTPPETIEMLCQVLHQAYAARLEKDPQIQVVVKGESLSHLKLLSIDLTGSRVLSTYQPKSGAKTVQANPFMRVDRLQYTADPLKYQTYQASLSLEATDAHLALMPDAENKLSLAMYDCKEGSARFQIELDDLEQSLVTMARMRGALPVRIQSIVARLHSQSERNLETEITVQASVMLIPARFRLVGRADVDASFNVHFSSLTAQGDDPSGALIAAVLQSKLDKLNNKAAPLLKLPGDKIRVTDLKITLDQHLTIDVKFAGTRSVQE